MLNRLLHSLLTLLGILIVAARRLRAGRALALVAAFGLTLIVAFTMGIPLYADAVYHRVLGTEIARGAGWRRPPFAFLFRYVARSQPVLDQDDWSRLAPTDRFMIEDAPAALGLPRDLLVRYFATDSFPVFAAAGGDPDSSAPDEAGSRARAYLSVGHLSEVEGHAVLVEGAWPQERTSPDAPMEVLVSEGLAEKLGLQVGQEYVVFANRVKGFETSTPIVISGIWAPTDAADPYWFTDPSALDSILLTTEGNYIRYVAPRMRGDTSIAVWFMDFDAAEVRSDDVAGLLARSAHLQTRLESMLPGLRLEKSPQRSLELYRQKSRLLSIQLLAFSLPLLLLLFAFTTLVAGLMAENRRNETAVLRSRGASVSQIVAISWLEAGVLAVPGLVAGAAFALYIARLIGVTRSFLAFDRAEELTVLLTPTALLAGLLAVGAAMVVIVAPVLGFARRTIVTYKQERARTMRPPWWQRAWLDVLLLVPAAYGTYLLWQQGTITLPSALTTTSGEDPFGNPLLFLVPAFAMVALTLLLLRLMPFLLRLLAWFLGPLPGVSLALATRQLARSPSFYVAPLLLLVLTLSLATYSASLAATLDQHLLDRVRYRVGGDMSLVEAELTMKPATLPGQTADSEPAGETEPERPPRASIPISEYASLDGVEEATGVGSFKATARLGSANVTGQLVGVERVGFGRVAFWRHDFADRPLGALMNSLAMSSDALLVPERVMQAQGLSAGDRVLITVSLPEGQATIPFRVAGSFRLWPGWHPDPGDYRVKSAFVANLEYISEQVGFELPYRVWLKLSPGVEPSRVLEEVDGLGVSLLRADYTSELIGLEQAKPERQGLFGVLSVGFTTAAVLTVVGFFMSVLFSLRRRTIELGVLRAVGMSSRGMARLLGWELVLLLGAGIVAGTLLGLSASRLYIPFLQIGATAEARTVPFRVILPWEALAVMYALFGVMFVVALGSLVVFALKIRVFQAVKLGETG